MLTRWFVVSMVKPRTRRSFDGAQDLGFASDESGGELPFPFEGSTKGGGGGDWGGRTGYSTTS